MSSIPDMVDIAQLAIVKYPAPVLRVKCAAVEVFDERLAALAARMRDLMLAAPGVGLAAPQVGVPLRLIVVSQTGEAEDARAYVNPEITEMSGSAEAEEGCLSLPNVTATMRRALTCSLRARDLDGGIVEVSATELEARIWQHEIDHLNGVLIIDRMGPTDKVAMKRAIKQLEDDYPGG